MSVIIPAYNAERYIRQAVTSALEQTHADLEVIVVDDGSREPVDWITELDPARVRCVRKENGGPASARNHGARLATGELLAFLDADDLWYPRKLAVQLDALAQNPAAALVCSRWDQIDSDGCVVSEGPLERSNPSGWVFERLFSGNFIGTLTVLVRRSVFEEAGGFDESRELIAVEDYEFWLRLAERHPIVFLEDRLASYRLHAGGISNDPAVSYAREELVVLRAVARRPDLAPTLPERLGSLFFSCGMDRFQRRQIERARSDFSSSVRHYPWRAAPWLYLGMTLLGERPVHAVRRAKELVREVVLARGAAPQVRAAGAQP